MTKKIILIIGILIIIGLALFFILFSGKTESGGGDSRVGFSIRDYLPFGNSGSTNNAGTNNNTDSTTTSGGNIVDNNNTDSVIARLRKISEEPTAGSVIFNQGTTSIVRFVERGTGNVYEVRSDSNQIKRLTNTTIPKVVRAFWLPDGSGFLSQNIASQSEIVETNFVKLIKNTNVGGENLNLYDTVISKLPTNIVEISISPKGDKIFYYTKTSIANFYTSKPDGTNETLVTTHPLTEWLPTWVDGEKIILQSKSDSRSTGYVYTLSLGDKIMRNESFGYKGISIKPNKDGSSLVISTGGTNPNLFVKDKNNEYTSLNIRSIADKCVWAQNSNPIIYCGVPISNVAGNYPEDWYKGILFSDDLILKVDLITGIFDTVSNLTNELEEKIDVEEMSTSKDDSHLVFRNKTNGSLWLLRISE